MNPDWRNKQPATEKQKEKLRFFGCTWDDGITAGQASDALKECAKLFPDFEAAYQNLPTTLERLDEAPTQEVTIQEAVKPQNVSPQDYTLPARVVQDYARRTASQEPAKEIIPTLAGPRVDVLLKDCPSSDGFYWLPVAKAVSLAHILTETKITIGQSRLIADKIELAGYCVEPDARFGSGSYDWNQTLGLFKPSDGDFTKPSSAYFGAANLLRLCVLIAVADGRIDQVELDVFRQVIESQLDFSQTDHQRLLVLERLLAQDPSSVSKTLAKVAKSVPAHKRLLVGKVLVRVAAADKVITKEERRALERIFNTFELSSSNLDKLIQQVGPPPNEVTIQRANSAVANNERILPSQHTGIGATEISPADKEAANLAAFNKWMRTRLDSIPTMGGERNPQEVVVVPPKRFALDMSRVSVITNETREVVGILSVVMEDEPEKAAAQTRPATVAVPEFPKISSEGKAAPQPTRFAGLDVAFHPILERLLTRDSWPQADFNALAREFHFMPLKIHDTLNEWADEVLGDFIFDGEDPVVIRRELIAKETI